MDTKENKNPSVKVTKHGIAQAENAEKGWDVLQREAEVALSPSFSSAAIVEAYAKVPLGKIDVIAIISTLNEQLEEIQRGNMSGPEAMLYSQAVALQSMFVHLSRKAIAQEYVAQYQTFMALAFKAQAQCRTTLEALNEVKFPKSATFVKQANIAQQQQVNNGIAARAEKKADPANELLTEANHGTLDTGATEPAGQSHPTMETLGAVHGAKNQPGQKTKRTERP
jgi:hypothetical protein